ncbi:uncharacterized protein LOC134716783 [Mytilus trossulus]|uniref:uncharacterized protein LOC134716783 n=1 Tax=Mytilus trossulus TaxID=6551 RepID=UPI003006FD85
MKACGSRNDYAITILLVAFIISCNASNNLEKHKQCHFEVEKKSGNYLSKWLKIIDGMVAPLDISFTNNNTYSSTPDVLLPNRWIWTFVPPFGGKFYISWPVDYFVYSFGLLDTHTLYPTRILLNVTPPDCNVTFGEPKTTEGIGGALQKMATDQHFYKINEMYDYSYWCYLSRSSYFNNSFYYSLSRYLNVPLQLLGYKCCQNRGKKLICDHKNVIENSYQLIPFYIGLVFLVYFPLALLKFGQNVLESSNDIPHLSLQSEYSIIPDQDDDYIFMRTRSPLSVFKMIVSAFGLAKKHPVIVSRVRRAIFVILAPFLVYIFIFLYYKKGRYLMKEIVNHKIPHGFVSVVGGFTESLDLYLPMFGGPAISLILYLIVGLILTLVPRSLSDILQLGLSPDESTYSTLLTLDLVTIEKFSKKKCSHNVSGYRRFYSVMRGSLYMLINPSFWCFVLSFQKTRLRKVIDKLCPGCVGTTCMAIICIPVFVSYFCFCILETFLVIFYYGFPFCYFVVSTAKGYAKYFQRAQQKQTFMLNVVLSILFPICFLFFMFMLVMISLETFIITGYFIFFVYLSLIIFPGWSFGFVYYVIMFILYVHSVLKDFKQEYQDLLHHTIQASVKVKKAAIAKELLNKRQKCCAMSEFIAITNRIPLEIFNQTTSIQDDNRIEYVRYRKQIPGVREDLYRFVIDRSYPVHIAFFHIIVQILVLQVIVLISILFISTYIKRESSRESSDVLNVMCVIIVTMIPNLVRLFFCKVHNNKVRKRKIRQKVIEFWRTRNNFNIENDNE